VDVVYVCCIYCDVYVVYVYVIDRLYMLYRCYLRRRPLRQDAITS
jgi:hypothetical protein